jgi:hypothetical protein
MEHDQEFVAVKISKVRFFAINGGAPLRRELGVFGGVFEDAFGMFSGHVQPSITLAAHLRAPASLLPFHDCNVAVSP